MDHIIESFNLHDPPKNMYFSHQIGGMRDGKKHKKLTFGLPVLGFAQAKQDSDDWFIISYRVNVIPDVMDFYYTDEAGVMLEMHPLPTTGDNYTLFDTGDIDTLFFNTTEGIHEAIIVTYERALPTTQKLPRELVDYESLYDFLKEYRPFIIEHKPSMLV